MPKPADTSTVADAGAKTTKGPGTGSQSRVIPNIGDIVKKVNNLNLDKELSEFLDSSLQDLSTGLFWYPGWVRFAFRPRDVNDFFSTKRRGLILVPRTFQRSGFTLGSDVFLLNYYNIYSEAIYLNKKTGIVLIEIKMLSN
ncbi:hypothetical protein AVEN_158748-1 [Araneus ventricosus]|uniref:Uncharacterized protein n=1 Tax=Araneus ventricosus TaxID=182803 RepID=A0A4Y2SJR3_ARAVE|nr:hypothetical protein AVEN_158748-1 [Araneus ventricosus]